MPQVSKYPISKEVAERIFELFTKTLIRIKSIDDANRLVYDLFTPTEKIMLAKRVSIAFLLMKGYQYREISRLLRVSLATVASVNLSLRLGKGGYKMVLEKIAKEEKLEEFFLGTAAKLLAPMEAQRKGYGWRYLKAEVEKDKRNRVRKF